MADEDDRSSGAPERTEFRPTATYWAEEAGPRWVREREQHDQELAPLLTAMLDVADPRPGERVIDVGCGAGTSTLEAARLVGPTGRVVGVDVSPALVAELERRIAATSGGTPGLDVRAVLADAQDADLPGPFDLLISRCGVMFFEDQLAAWTNLRRAMAGDGRAAVVVWQEQHANPWMAVPVQAALAVSPATAPPPGPGEPGAHALADRDRTTTLLTSAGWHDVGFTDVQLTMDTGPDLDSAVAHVRTLASVAAAVDRVGPERVDTALREALTPYVGPDGAVRMQAAAMVVTAQA